MKSQVGDGDDGESTEKMELHTHHHALKLTCVLAKSLQLQTLLHSKKLSSNRFTFLSSISFSSKHDIGASKIIASTVQSMVERERQHREQDH